MLAIYAVHTHECPYLCGCLSACACECVCKLWKVCNIKMACPRCVVDRVTLDSIKQLLQRESMLNPCCWLLLPPCWSWWGCNSSRAARASRATLIYEIFGGRGKSRASWHRSTPSNLGRHHHGAALHWFCGCHKLWLRLTVKSFWLGRVTGERIVLFVTST